MHILIIFILLIMLVSTNAPIYPFYFMVEGENGISMIFSIPKITAKSDINSIITPHRVIEEVDPTNLENSVRDLSSFHTRHTESEFLDYVAHWLTEKLQSVCSKEVYVQNFTYTPENTNDDDDDYNDNDDENNDINSNHRQGPYPYTLKNIACEKPGTTNNTIIISAHYDSRMEDINNRTARAPGADDNASGVSALLEVARILSNISLNYGIIFVLFSGEEQGKWGSTYYADYIDKTDLDLDLLINLDMIGFSSQGSNDFLIEYDSGHVVHDNDRYSRAVAKFIKYIASEYTNLNATLGTLGNADYLPFEALGYTVIGFHDDGVIKNPNFHTVTDTPDTLNYQYLTSTTKLILAMILSLNILITTEDPGYAPSFLLK
jgi:hypothetical protein